MRKRLQGMRPADSSDPSAIGFAGKCRLPIGIIGEYISEHSGAKNGLSAGVCPKKGKPSKKVKPAGVPMRLSSFITPQRLPQAKQAKN